MVSNNCKSSEKKDGITGIEEQWRWGNIVQNDYKTSMSTKDNNDALKQERFVDGMTRGWGRGGGIVKEGTCMA